MNFERKEDDNGTNKEDEELFHCNEKAEHTMMSGDVATKLVICLLITIEKLKGNGTEYSLRTIMGEFFKFYFFLVSQESMLRAYFLAFLTHLVTKTLTDLHTQLFGEESLEAILETKPIRTVEMPKQDALETEIEDELPKKKSKKRLDRFKRIRRRGSESDEKSESDENSSSEGDCKIEHSEHIVKIYILDLSQSESDEDDGSVSDENDDDYRNGALHFDSDDESSVEESDEDDVIIESTKDIRSAKDAAEAVAKHHLNTALRICFSW